jgi:hypothetical protein
MVAALLFYGSGALPAAFKTKRTKMPGGISGNKIGRKQINLLFSKSETNYS